MDRDSQKIIAIGDLHGHYDELMALMEQLKDYDKDEYTFVFLGDYVDGGLKTKEVIDQLIEWQKQYPHWKFLYGNHEDLLIDALLPHHPVYGDYYMWFKQGGEQTKMSYCEGLTPMEIGMSNMRELMPEDHLSFILGLDTYYETDNYFFVHGGIYPGTSIEENKEKTSRYDMIWMREWITSKYDWGKKIIFGHTINYNGAYPPYKHLEPIVYPNKIGIDTMMHNTGSITALILPEEKFYIQTSLTTEDLNL